MEVNKEQLKKILEGYKHLFSRRKIEVTENLEEKYFQVNPCSSMWGSNSELEIIIPMDYSFIEINLTTDSFFRRMPEEILGNWEQEEGVQQYYFLCEETDEEFISSLGFFNHLKERAEVFRMLNGLKILDGHDKDRTTYFEGKEVVIGKHECDQCFTSGNGCWYTDFDISFNGRKIHITNNGGVDIY